MSLQWLQQQRATPSFASAKGMPDQQQSALDQPMPEALRGFGGPEVGGRSVAESPMSPSSPLSQVNASIGGLSSARRARTPPAGGSSAPRARSSGATYTSQIVDTRGMPKQIDVFESLYERAKLGAVAKDLARADAEREKLRRCRSVPKINKLNDDNVMAPTSSIFQRLYNKEQERQVRHHTKVLIMQKKEDEHFATLFQPRISSKGHRAKSSSNSATSTEKYSFKTVQRMEELRKEKIMREMEMLLDTPDINPKSKQLAQKQREREGMAGYTHIEAMLERDRLNKLARYEQRERELIAQYPGTPRITEYAAGLQRGGESAAERLYRAAATPNRSRAAANDTTNTQTSQGPGNMSSIYSSTPIRPEGHGVVGGEFHNLARHASETKARRDERMRQIEETERQSYAPAINPVSASIAARLPTTTEERLAAATPRRAATSTLSSSSAPKELDGDASQGGVAPSARDVQLFERLRIAEARRKMRIEAARSEMEQRRDNECTFSPVTTTSYYPPQKRTDSDLYARSQQWQQSRDDRLRLQKAEHDQLNSQEYTFQPAVSRKTQEIYERGGKYAHEGDDAVAGFDSFIARHQRAKPATHDVSAASQPISTHGWNASTAIQSTNTPSHANNSEHNIRYEKTRAPSPSASAIASIRRPVDPPSFVAQPPVGASDADRQAHSVTEDARSIRANLFDVSAHPHDRHHY